jgi:HD-GYP domain-containing protein (c-di-GMP phosphodiesterase class II)
LLHDIGEIVIPDSSLFKPGKLTTQECEILRKHPAYALLLVSSLRYLKDAMKSP